MHSADLSKVLFLFATNLCAEEIFRSIQEQGGVEHISLAALGASIRKHYLGEAWNDELELVKVRVGQRIGFEKRSCCSRELALLCLYVLAVAQNKIGK